jgi:transketolase
MASGTSGPDYEDEGEDLTIVEREFGYESRVLNLHTLKPIDEAAITWAAKETGIVLTAEEHQIGALAWRVSHVTTSPFLYGQPVISSIGVKDRFGDSGASWELIKEFEVSAEHIAHKAVELVDIKKSSAPSRRVSSPGGQSPVAPSTDSPPP